MGLHEKKENKRVCLCGVSSRNKKKVAQRATIAHLRPCKSLNI